MYAFADGTVITDLLGWICRWNYVHMYQFKRERKSDSENNLLILSLEIWVDVSPFYKYIPIYIINY